jgi:acyl transferase domain-containing protein
VYGAARPGRPFVLGAVKSNIGHLESASGIAGLIKAVLCLQHGVIPPNGYYKTPTPHFTLEEINAIVPTSTAAWPEHDVVRNAGLSSFGLKTLAADMAKTLVAEPTIDADELCATVNTRRAIFGRRNGSP